MSVMPLSSGKIAFLNFSGDASLDKVDEQYPVFGMSIVVMDREQEERASAQLRDLLERHDFKTREFRIGLMTRGLSGDYRRLRKSSLRDAFWAGFQDFVAGVSFVGVACVVDKRRNVANRTKDARSVFDRTLGPVLDSLDAELDDESGLELFAYQRGEYETRALLTALGNIKLNGTTNLSSARLTALFPSDPSDGKQNSAAFPLSQLFAGACCRAEFGKKSKAVLGSALTPASASDSSGSDGIRLYKVKRVARNSQSTPLGQK